MEEHEGKLPASYETLLKLPGIGSYTAGAIASIAYGIPVPAVDGNVLRVISRVLASKEDILKQSVKRQMEEDLKRTMPGDRAGAFNQGLIEIGAIVCIPNGQPKCGECPLASICLARKQGLLDSIPYKAPKKPRKIEERTILLIESGSQIAIQKRPDRGLLASLYEFPNLEGRWTEEEVAEMLVSFLTDKGGEDRRQFIDHIEKAGDAKHVFSHVEWHMTGYRIKMREIPPVYMTVDRQELLEKYPLPNAFSAYTKLIHGK